MNYCLTHVFVFLDGFTTLGILKSNGSAGVRQSLTKKRKIGAMRKKKHLAKFELG